MEGLSNLQENGNSNVAGSNVELTLLGIDKKWVRSNGSWVDKSKLPVLRNGEESSFMSTEIEGSSSHWWQFWKA
ncbi:MAG: hypothetical protein P8P74_00160 [Crocinitomicaceae bacterium]|nr:hypothetical protein [Crocinitomicaceae bacterium]